MMLLRASIIYFVILSLTPTILNAGSCKINVNRIRDGLKQTTQSNDAFWMSLPKLQQIFGQTEKIKMTDGQNQYKWVCPENGNITLSVTTTEDGRVTKINGEFSDENGAELYSSGDLTTAALAPMSTLTTPPPATTTTSLAPNLVSSTQPSQVANACEDTIKQINNDIDSSLASHNIINPKYSWMDLSLLKQTMGSPTVEEETNHLYQWDFSSVFTGSGSFIVEGRPISGVNAKSSVDDLIHLLGAPKHIMTETIYNYHWQCPNNNRLSIRADKNGQILSLSGVMGEKTFGSNSLGKSELEIKLVGKRTADINNSAN